MQGHHHLARVQSCDAGVVAIVGEGLGLLARGVLGLALAEHRRHVGRHVGQAREAGSGLNRVPRQPQRARSHDDPQRHLLDVLRNGPFRPGLLEAVGDPAQLHRGQIVGNDRRHVPGATPNGAGPLGLRFAPRRLWYSDRALRPLCDLGRAGGSQFGRRRLFSRGVIPLVLKPHLLHPCAHDQRRLHGCHAGHQLELREDAAGSRCHRSAGQARLVDVARSGWHEVHLAVAVGHGVGGARGGEGDHRGSADDPRRP
mmetsp:Transcript_9527/g.27592  ORF Transcript_9527/g.27592 Transcript_9527/m.27592 type:complete len:256 (-) Transcript_9527:266-1033(-)